MWLLADVYGLNSCLNKEDARVQSRVKKMLQNKFGDQMLFCEHWLSRGTSDYRSESNL